VTRQTKGAFSPVEQISAAHVTAGFDCGSEELNRYLEKYALANTRADGAVTRVTTREGRVVGYYSLAAGAAEQAEAPARVKKGLARHPIPLVILARLAVDRRAQGVGLGEALLKDALVRVAAAADLIGVRALIAHAKDENAKAFYERFDFEPSPTDPLHMFLLMKDLRASLA
jgi:GNAT superfamily N-acetyltransferase